MSVTRASVARQGMIIQSGLSEIGAVPDLSPAEIAAHQGTLDTLAGNLKIESDNQTVLDEESVKNQLKWQDTWDLCERVRDIAIGKTPNASVQQVMERAKVSGGFTVSRARKWVAKVVSALEQHYPESFTILGKTRAQIVTELQAGFASDKIVSDARAKIQGAQADIRILVPQIDAENDRILSIVDASFEEGTREHEIATRMHLKTPAPAKKDTDKDPEPSK